jgi:hypothetical protein
MAWSFLMLKTFTLKQSSWSRKNPVQNIYCSNLLIKEKTPQNNFTLQNLPCQRCSSVPWQDLFAQQWKCFVCTDFSKKVRNSNLSVSGFRFKSTTTVFLKPFPLSDYHITIFSKLEEHLYDVTIQQIKEKMYALPMSISSEELISDNIPEMSCKKTKWYVSQLFHTIYCRVAEVYLFCIHNSLTVTQNKKETILLRNQGFEHRKTQTDKSR